MKASLSRLIDFLFLRLSLEVASGMAALYCGAHWMFWRTFDLPPYRVLCNVAALTHVPGEFLWGIPLSILGLGQIVGAWRRDLTQRRLVSRALAMLMVLIAVIMMATLARSIVAWFIFWGAVVQLSVFFQLPGPANPMADKLCCMIVPPVPLLLGDSGFDKQTTIIVGTAVGIAVLLIPAIDTVKKWIRPEGGMPSPLLVKTPVVFATVEDVTRVDQDLNKKVEKLDQYLHESIHRQGNAMGSLSKQILDSEDTQQAAIEDVNKQGEARIERVHARLDIITRDIGGLDNNSKTTNNALTEMQRTLNILLSRTAPNQRGGHPE